MQKKALISVSGLVQGVGYRYFCVRQANRLQICGYARNLADGTVEVAALGEESNLKEYINRLQSGPAGAEVENVSVEWQNADGSFQDFYIIP